MRDRKGNRLSDFLLMLFVISFGMACVVKQSEEPAGDESRPGSFGFGISENEDLTASPRLILCGVSAGSPAEKAGLKGGDGILAVDGHAEFRHPADFMRYLFTIHAGEEVVFEVIREGEVHSLTVIPEEATEEQVEGRDALLTVADEQAQLVDEGKLAGVANIPPKE